MKVIYIAGPFRGDTSWQIECNVRDAEALGLEVARAGAMPLIPHANTRFFDGELTDDFWLRGTLALLRAVFMAAGGETEYDQLQPEFAGEVGIRAN